MTTTTTMNEMTTNELGALMCHPDTPVSKAETCLHILTLRLLGRGKVLGYDDLKGGKYTNQTVGFRSGSAVTWLKRRALKKGRRFNEQAAQDAVTDALMDVWTNRKRFDATKAAFGTWFFNILSRNYIDQHRKELREYLQDLRTFSFDVLNDELNGEGEDEEGGFKPTGHLAGELLNATAFASPEDNVLWQEAEGALMASVEALPTAERRAITREIAPQWTDEPRKASHKMALSRARTKLEASVTKVGPSANNNIVDHDETTSNR